MEAKQIEIACPCCNSRLMIDVRSQKVLRHLRPEELDATGKPIVRDADWNEAFNKVRGRSEGVGDKFDQALNRERTRAKDLDALFDRANDSLDDDEEN